MSTLEMPDVQKKGKKLVDGGIGELTGRAQNCVLQSILLMKKL